MVGILLSYWGGLFSGATLVSGRVSTLEFRGVMSETDADSPFFGLGKRERSDVNIQAFKRSRLQHYSTRITMDYPILSRGSRLDLIAASHGTCVPIGE